MKKITDENGKVYILVPEEVYNEDKPERARTGYERVNKDNKYYYTLGGDMPVKGTEEYDFPTSVAYGCGNYYNDEQLAKDNARADSILRRMRQWQALNDVAVDTYGNTTRKLSIAYNAKMHSLEIYEMYEVVHSHEVYFSTEEKAEEALEVFRDDLIWLHTEYRRRLDEVRERDLLTSC